MKSEKQTKEKLLISAQKEFMEKGYNGASLRNICKNAGVTTGAMYFFFKDKEDLFASIVREPFEKLLTLMNAHYKEELKHINRMFELNKDFKLNVDFKEDKEAAIMILDYLYKDKDVFILLLMKSQGSSYENCMDEVVSITEKHYRILADKMSEICKVESMDDYTLHWYSHLQIFSFAQFLMHGISREEAMKQIENLMKFLVGGWFGFFQE